MFRTVLVSSLVLIFGFSISRGQAVDIGATDSPPPAPVVSSATAAPPPPVPVPRKAPIHHARQNGLPPDVWPKTARVKVYVHRAAARWKPISLQLAPVSISDSSFVLSQVIRIKTKKGWFLSSRRCEARVKAAAHPYKGDIMLVVSLYPYAWEKRLTHLELHYLVSAGYLESVSAEIVRIEGGSQGAWGLDSFALTQKGISFSEEFAGRGRISLSASNPARGSRSVNAAKGTDFDFGDESLGRVDFSYRVSGVKAAIN